MTTPSAGQRVPRQEQEYPGRTAEPDPRPRDEMRGYEGHGLLTGTCVAPGPVWTPLIPATFDADRVRSFGEQVPMGRTTHPREIAPSYVFFASGRLSGHYSGEVLAPIGGETRPG